MDVVTLRGSRRRDGIRAHRSASLDPVVDVVRRPGGLSATSVERTLLDLATAVSPHRLEHTCHRAEVLRLLDMAAIAELLARLPRHRGSARLRRAVASLEVAEPIVTRSELEERMLALVVNAGLPVPEVNRHVEGYEVDFLWRDARLVVETDGRHVHLTPSAFERDRRKDAALQVAGYRVVRFTWRQVVEEPAAVAETLRALLAG